MRESSRPNNRQNVLAICPDQRMLSELKPLISQHLPLTPVVEITAYPERQALQTAMSSQAPTLCFLDAATRRDSALSMISTLLSIDPALQIVVLLAANEPDLILGCLRQGASEFLLQPFSSDQLHPVLERLAQLHSRAGGETRGGAKVYGVLSVKGACGSTTIATNLAYQWKRHGQKKILLADLDPMTGTVSFLLKLKSTYSFVDALSRRDGLDSDLWKGLVTQYQGVDVLLSPENPMDGLHDLGDPDLVVNFCRQAYESVTLDLGASFGEWTLSLVNLCDELLLVTTNELPALRATQRALLYFDANRIDRAKIRLIINRFNSDVGLSQEAIETALHNDVFHLIPSDYESAQKALMEGKPIASGTDFGRNMLTLADRLSGKKIDPTGKKKRKESTWSSLFSSLVSKATS